MLGAVRGRFSEAARWGQRSLRLRLAGSAVRGGRLRRRLSWSGSAGARSLGLWGLGGLIRSPEGNRDEVIVTVVAPVEIGAGGSVPDLNRVVVRSVDDDGVVASTCKHMGVLFVAPFAVRT